MTLKTLFVNGSMNIFKPMKQLTIPLQSEVAKYMKEKKGWPQEFCDHYAEKFWMNYQAQGWKLSNGNAMKDWKAAFCAQWQTLKFKDDIDKLNSLTPTIFLEKVDIFKSELQMLEIFIDKLRKPGIGVNIPFKEFGIWYTYMKEHRLLKPFTKGEIEEIKTIYKDDNWLCRCAVVQKTLMGYINNGLLISDLLKMRQNLTT